MKMLSQKEIAIVYETVFRVPKMEEEVKVSFKISRKDILLLSQIIARGVIEEQARGVIPVNKYDALQGLESELLSQGNFSSEFMEHWRELINSKMVG